MSQQDENENRSHDDDYQQNHDNENDDLKSETDDIAGKIFIGGLSWSTTEQTLRYYFEKYGELTDVALMVDKRTGKPR
jgi:RNA recognition motif-containing protein